MDKITAWINKNPYLISLSLLKDMLEIIIATFTNAASLTWSFWVEKLLSISTTLFFIVLFLGIRNMYNAMKKKFDENAKKTDESLKKIEESFKKTEENLSQSQANVFICQMLSMRMAKKQVIPQNISYADDSIPNALIKQEMESQKKYLFNAFSHYYPEKTIEEIEKTIANFY